MYHNMLNYVIRDIYLVDSYLFNFNIVMNNLTYKYLLPSYILCNVDFDKFFRL